MLHNAPQARTGCKTRARDGNPFFKRLLFLLLSPALALGCGSNDTVPTKNVWFVRPNGQGDFLHIQPCIENARNGNTCFVYPGTYRENIRFNGKQISVASLKGPGVTVLDGGLAGPVVRFENYETSNSTLSGFTLVNGKASFSDTGNTEAPWSALAAAEPGEEHGGGIRILAASPVIRNCVLRDNTADGNGGGVYCAFSGSQPLFDNVVFQDNSAGGQGGGLYVFSGLPELSDCLFTRNAAETGGAIAAGFGAEVSLSNGTLADNEATSGDGAEAILLFNSSAVWTDSIVGSTPWQEAPENPLVVLNLDRTEPSPGPPASLSLTLDHVDLQGDVADILYQGDCIAFPDLCTPETRGAVQGDPLFVSLAGTEDDPGQAFYLSQTVAGQGVNSPCLDAGSRSAEQAGVNTRTTQNGQNGKQLPDEGVVDLGFHNTIILP